ncbi:MAG: PcfK-like family protein [Rikenellaceae bacterium]
MKGTQNFETAIKDYLELRADMDSLFAEKFYNPNKSIGDCATYIMNWVKDSGCVGFTDDEIYSQAMHYYDEEEIDVGQPINGNIVVNHVVELTEEEIEQARQDAIKRVQNEHYQKLTKKAQKPKSVVAEESSTAPSLFDL